MVRDASLRAVAQARSEQCDFILAVGGGSVIDGSKFIAAALAYPGEPFDLLSGSKPKAGLVPVNTNYRYQGDELVYLWDDADVVAVVFHGSFAVM